VFCNLGTPSARSRSASSLSAGWNAYDELKQLLIERGVPAEKIRYVHEARNDKEKGEMFAAARNGRISVLLGSTEKMGVGTNVQARAIALHHLDCPWRPADIAQREGRLLRQGNLNPEVEAIRYVSEGSFDAYLWQTSNARPASSARSCAGGPTSARSKTSATPPCPTARSKPSRPETPASWRKPASTPS